MPLTIFHILHTYHKPYIKQLPKHHAFAPKYPHSKKHEKKKLAGKIWRDDTYKNRKLQKRLNELMFAHGLTQMDLCKALGIAPEIWGMISRGVRKPSQKFITRLMEILGDEVILLFLSYYLSDSLPDITSAEKYEKDQMTNFTKEKIKEFKEKGIKLTYPQY